MWRWVRAAEQRRPGGGEEGATGVLLPRPLAGGEVSVQGLFLFPVSCFLLDGKLQVGGREVCGSLAPMVGFLVMAVE